MKALRAMALLALIPLAVLAFQLLHDPGRDQQGSAGDPVRGAYLVRAGNCMGCHTTAGGQPNAGGRAIHTGFGTIYTSNITPDRETGIGNWSADDFWRALHNGKSRDGSFLYPAFPYPSYTRVSRADADAMYAWFMRQPPVRQPNRAPALAFPYNQRILLAFWRALYFTPGEFEADPARTAQWNRGAYLVQGLGHCAACHTGRNALGGGLAQELGGGALPATGWYAASLTTLGDWDSGDLASLLNTGVSRRGAVSGPMAEVVAGSLQHVSPSDTLAMAMYLTSLPQSARPAPAHPGPDSAAVLRSGAAIYGKQCAACHMDDGKGQGNAYPPLAGNRALEAAPGNAIRMVLHGGYPPSTGGNPRPYGMPPFGHALSDAEAAAVLSYVRTSWGNRGAMVSPAAVNQLRGVPATTAGM